MSPCFPSEVVLFASHDQEFVATVANRIIEITPNGLIDQPMAYGEYLHSEKVKNMRAELYGETVMMV